jgi:hypothetical protein
MQSKPEACHPDDRLTPDDDPILAKAIVGGGEPGEVAGPVDLDDEADIGPGNVQVDAAIGQLSHHLTIRRWETMTTAHRREVQLAERLRPADDGSHQLGDESAPPTMGDDTCSVSQLGGLGEAEHSRLVEGGDPVESCSATHLPDRPPASSVLTQGSGMHGAGPSPMYGPTSCRNLASDDPPVPRRGRRASLEKAHRQRARRLGRPRPVDRRIWT